MKDSVIITESALTGLISTVGAFNGEMILAWVMFAINVATLLSNAALAIYRKWKHRDDEGEEK